MGFLQGQQNRSIIDRDMYQPALSGGMDCPKDPAVLKIVRVVN